MIPLQSTSQPPSHSQDTAPIQRKQPSEFSPSDDKPPTSEIIITNESSLTTNAYAVLKDPAIVDMKKLIHETTEKGEEEIGKAVATAKLSVIKDLNTEYEAIVKELSVYDTKKEELEKNHE